MGRYRTIIRYIEAVRWNGSNLSEIIQFAGSSHMVRENTKPGDSSDVALEYFDIVTKDWVHVPKQRWIVRKDDGLISLVEDEAFKSEYEAIPAHRSSDEDGAFPPSGRRVPRTPGQHTGTTEPTAIELANSERHGA